MAAVARVALPSTRRRPSTLPPASTTALRTTVPSVLPGSASTGYFGGMLYASRFSAPLEDRMTALSSAGSGVVEGIASFLASLDLLSGPLTDDAAGIALLAPR